MSVSTAAYAISHPIETDTTIIATEELQPMAARGCYSYDYATFHDLLDAYNIGYTGTANQTQLAAGFSYTYTKSSGYWSIFLEGLMGPSGCFVWGV